MTLTEEDLDFITAYEPDMPLCGGIGAEIWRPAGFEQSIRHVQIVEKLGYANWGFTEQTQSWTFRSMWGLLPDSEYIPDYEAFYDTTTVVLCENDSEITRALESPYVRGSVLNLTPTGAHWKKWGGQHPFGEKYALSMTHRSTNFSRSELQEAFAKITEKDIQQKIYVGSPEDVAKRMLPWAKVMGHPRAPLGYVLDFGAAVFPEHRQLADGGLPRWHLLQQRVTDELNKLLAAM